MLNPDIYYFTVCWYSVIPTLVRLFLGWESGSYIFVAVFPLKFIWHGRKVDPNSASMVSKSFYFISVRTCYNIYLASRNMINQTTAKVHKWNLPYFLLIFIPMFRSLTFGSIPLTNESCSRSDSRIGSFHQWPSRCQQKIFFSHKFFAYYFLKLQFSSFSKVINKSQNSTNKDFCLMM